MRTKKWAMGLVFASTLSSATGQLLIKMGTNNVNADILSHDLMTIVWSVLPLLIGYGLYGVAAVALVISLKYGELSVLYPIYAMNFIWVALAAPIVFPGADSMNALKWAGVISVVFGVVLIGFGSKGAEHG
jgi:multidrug transporter EmrE-like cation transporter